MGFFKDVFESCKDEITGFFSLEDEPEKTEEQKAKEREEFAKKFEKMCMCPSSLYLLL